MAHHKEIIAHFWGKSGKFQMTQILLGIRKSHYFFDSAPIWHILREISAHFLENPKKSLMTQILLGFRKSDLFFSFAPIRHILTK